MSAQVNHFRITHPLARACVMAFVIAHLVAGGMLSAKDASTDNPGEGQDAIATVNGHAITHQQLMVTLVSRQGTRLLHQLIDEMLLAQAAQRYLVTVTAEDIEAEANRLRLQHPSEEMFQSALQKSGQTLAQIRDQLRVTVLIQKISRAQASAQVSRRVTRDYYDEHKGDFISQESVHLRDMLLDTRENAEELLKVLKSGGDFSGLATAFSTDPATHESGGDMGVLPVGSLAPHLANAVKTMKPGGISPIIEAPDGWYILKLEKRTPASQRSFEEVRRQIENKLVEERARALQSDLLQRLRKDAHIEVDENALRTCVQDDHSSADN
ncbi:MAG: hypothetical protein AUJ92_14355 [Armatimonadetes bacterium CG2_30_59_28]|nr:hypothetical protein [Armatimonadota bacterium]OIO92397.1 MAG: hypothetical protein AUJ92_14355 [Armatimonadetes bacterium CG2_30_59_28]